MTEQRPWERRTDESSKAFHAFMLYRDMPPNERTLDKVRLKLARPSLGYLRHLKNWSTQYGWVSRATAYDDHLAQSKQQSQEKAIQEMAERQAREGMALQNVGMRYFFDEAGKLRMQAVDDLKGGDAVRALEVGTRIERAARGEPENVVNTQINIIDPEVAVRLLFLAEKIKEEKPPVLKMIRTSGKE